MGSSPAWVAAVVVGGLIEAALGRDQLLRPLARIVATAVEELDPDGVRDRHQTWWVDLPPWARLDAYDRLRKSYEDLLLVEGQAEEVVGELRALGTKTVVGAHRPWTACRDDLVMFAAQRRRALRSMRLAERRLRDRLSVGTAKELRRTVRVLEAFEASDAAHRETLSRLLALPELARAG